MDLALLHCPQKRIIWDESLQLYLPLYHGDLMGSPIWSFDKNHHSCSVTGALWTSRGRSFDGVDDVINCGSDASLDGLGTTGDYKFTIMAWVKPNSLGENNVARIIDKNTFYLYVLATARVRLILNVGAVGMGAVSANNSVPFGSWSHVVGVFNGSNVLIYTNLTLVTGDATTGPIDSHVTNNFLIGDNTSSNRCFNGLIGEFAAYNRAFAYSEKDNNYLATRWRYQ